MNESHNEEPREDISDELLEAAAMEKAGLWTNICTSGACPGSPA